MTVCILPDINDQVVKYLNGTIKNPILKKVIEEEILTCENLEVIFEDYLSNIVVADSNKLNNISELLLKLGNNIDSIRKIIIKSFVKLSSDEQLYLIMNINDTNNMFFKILGEDQSIYEILNHLVSALGVTIKDEKTFIKMVSACTLINKLLCRKLVYDYIMVYSDKVITNDELLMFLLNYILNNEVKNNNHYLLSKIHDLYAVKVVSIKESLNKLLLNNMDFAYEIYKLGKIIININMSIKSPSYENLQLIPIIEFSNEQLEYIAKSIHTCIVNNNINQAQTLLAIIYYMKNTDKKKFVEYYNKWLMIRIYKNSVETILTQEQYLWNINNQYNEIIKNSYMENYMKLINNLRYTRNINNDMKLVKIKETNTVMNKVSVMLVNGISDSIGNIIHHPEIKKYIDGLDKYIKLRAPLQNIKHDIEKSKITIKTAHGKIKCSLVIGSILMYLFESDKTKNELIELLKIGEDKLNNYVTNLIMTNIIIDIEKDGVVYYKYIEPYGDIECEELVKVDSKMVKISRFTDIEITVESRIMKEVKPKKLLKMELERRVQEFMGDDYVRSMFYRQLESLKSRMFIEEKDDYIIYVL